MSKLLTNQISNYNDNGPVEVKDGINVATGKPFQVAGANGTSGQYLKSTGSSVAWTSFPTTVAGYGITDAFSGAYADLTGKPSIPSNISDLADVATTAPTNDQVLKWNGSSWTPAADSAGIALNSISVSVNSVGTAGLTYNNSTGEFSYTPPDLSGYLTTLGSVGGHTDVNITNVQNNQILKYNSTTSKWENQAESGGGGGSTTFAGLTDTPANFTSQAGKFLKVNAGASALEFTDAPAGTTTFTGLTDTPANFTSQGGKWLRVNAGATALEFIAAPSNTTYSQSSVADGSNVKLRLTDSGSTNDDILITAGNNITISSVTAGGFTIASTASGGATVTTDDSAPSSPSDGDLWWKSDEGRLKVYYADGSSNQWVDASPPVSLDLTAFTGHILPATNDQQDIGSASKKIRDLYLGSTSLHLGAVDISESSGKLVLPAIEMTGHMIPDTNAAYDLGNAEYKIRHLFLSDNTVYFQGDFLKVAQHNSGGSAGSASYLIPLAKLKDALNASANYEAFKAAILGITDA